MARRNGQRVKKSPVSETQVIRSATILTRRLPRASIQKANQVFEDFSLSKFGKGLLPANYVHPYKTSYLHSHKEDVPPDHAERIKDVQDFQKKKIVDHLHELETAADHGPHRRGRRVTIKGITVALPKDKIAAMVPSFDREEETIELDELMDLVAKHTRGTELYAKGDPTLNRLALLGRIDKMKKSLGIYKHGEAKGDRR